MQKFLETFGGGGGGGGGGSTRPSTGRQPSERRASGGRPGFVERVVNAGRGFFGGRPGGGRAGIEGARRGFRQGVRAG